MEKTKSRYVQPFVQCLEPSQTRICQCCKRETARNGPAPYCWNCFFCETCDLQKRSCGNLTGLTNSG